MALGQGYAGQECALASALELVGERWTMLILRDAFYGVRRYSDFLAHVGAPRAVLAERLQSLTQAGILEKQRYQEAPPREEYALTKQGEALWPVVYSLIQWGETYLHTGGPKRIYVHVPCGTPLDHWGNCGACAVTVPPADIEIRPGPGAKRKPRIDAVSKALQQPHRLLEPLLPIG